MNIAILYDYLYNKITKEIFTKEDVTQYIYDIVTYLELNEYLTDVIFTDDRYVNLASYNFKDRNIKVSMKAIINEAKMMINTMKSKSSMELKINLFILESLIHEIHHVYHNYLISDTELPISQIFYNELSYFYLDDPEHQKAYEDYYSMLIFERDANISAIENILRIIQKYAKNDEVFEFYLSELKKFILTGYSVDNGKVISPIEAVYKDLLHYDLFSVDNIDLYDRLKLGFQVSKDEIEYFKDNSDTILLTKNNLHI